MNNITFEGEPITELDLVYIGSGDFPRYKGFAHQADTNTIATWRESGDRYVIQKVSGAFEVYDLKTLVPFTGFGFTIGVPKYVHEDFDAALMWAMLNL